MSIYNPSYHKFMREPDFGVSFYEMERITHGSDKDSFRKAYEDNYQKDGIKMFRKDDPKILRLGFVIADKVNKVWHTVRVNAWKPGELKKEFFQNDKS